MCTYRRVGFDGNFIRMTLLVPEGQRRKIQVSALGSLTRRQRSLWSWAARTHGQALPDYDSQQGPEKGSGKFFFLVADLPEQPLTTLRPSGLPGLCLESCSGAVWDKTVLWTLRHGSDLSICSSRECHMSQGTILKTLLSFPWRRKRSPPQKS